MKKINKKRIIIGIIAVGLFMIYEAATLIYTIVDDQETSSKVALTEYGNLFGKDAQTKLQILVTTKSRNRHPVSLYKYDKRFNVIVSKVSLLKYSDIGQMVNYENGTSYKSLNAAYEAIPSFNFDMSIKAGKSVSVSAIHFKVNGDSIRTIARNDSLVCFYYRFNTFSINYNDEPYDVIAKADRSTIPSSVIFKRKGKFLYVIIMTIGEGNEEMRPDLLYSIVDK
jgi:hypothetical protein